MGPESDTDVGGDEESAAGVLLRRRNRLHCWMVRARDASGLSPASPGPGAGHVSFSRAIVSLAVTCRAGNLVDSRSNGLRDQRDERHADAGVLGLGSAPMVERIGERRVGKAVPF